MLFLGTHDSNLRVLEGHFGAQIVARGGVLKVKGDTAEIERIRKVVDEMVFTLHESGSLKPGDVETIIRLQEAGKRPREERRLDEVVLFTESGFIKPRSAGQATYVKETAKSDIVFSIGPAGTGKTYLAVAVAVASLKEKEVKRIILTRPAVEAGEKLGFLPGDLKEKIEPYLAPLYDALADMVSPAKLRNLISKRVIEIIPLAYMRGRTLSSAYVILDEAQNTSPLQMKMLLTRLGADSKAIVTGDITQIDLGDSQASGLVQVQKVLKGIDGIGFVRLGSEDVVRHRLVKEIIEAYGEFNHDGEGGKVGG